jgi:hypothetical protein
MFVGMDILNSSQIAHGEERTQGTTFNKPMQCEQIPTEVEGTIVQKVTMAAKTSASHNIKEEWGRKRGEKVKTNKNIKKKNTIKRQVL